MSGRLHVVATPIGNLGDITRRAVEVLGSVDAVACEDTRHTGRLLQHLGVRPDQLFRCDMHTERAATGRIIELLASGKDVALVSDAGTPGVSDPGAVVVAAVVEAGFEVVPIPGASAALAALVASGLPTDRFVVEGFLPRKGGDRRRRLESIAADRRTTVVYESPRRVAATLADLADACGPDRAATVSRELTKLHEETVRGTLADLAEHFDDATKGEIVVVIGPAPEAPPASADDLDGFLEQMASDGLDRRAAIAAAVEQLGVRKRDAYDAALKLDWSSPPT